MTNMLTEIILKTFSLNGELVEFGNSICEEYSLTSSRWKVLGAASEQDRTVPQIARRMGLTRQSVQRIVTELINDGFITRIENPDHTSSPLLSLTKKGRSILKKINTKYYLNLENWAKDFPHDELEITIKTLEKLSSQLLSKKE